MLTKAQVINGIQQMPNTFSLDELLEKIILIDKIEKGLEQSKNNQVITDNQLKKKLGKWLD